MNDEETNIFEASEFAEDDLVPVLNPAPRATKQTNTLQHRLKRQGWAQRGRLFRSLHFSTWQHSQRKLCS